MLDLVLRENLIMQKDILNPEMAKVHTKNIQPVLFFFFTAAAKLS